MKPFRKDLKPGTEVLIIQKNDQLSGVLTTGILAEILTKSSSHPYGIKVRLETGEVGRVQKLN